MPVQQIVQIRSARQRGASATSASAPNSNMTLTWCCVVNGNWYGAVKCSAVLYGNWYGMVWCCVILYGIVQCSMPWQGLFQFDTCIRPNKSLWNDVSTWLSLKDLLQDILQTDSYGQRPLIESQITTAPIQVTFVQSMPT